eukprot:2847976-Amphidinium_carterae.2
MPELEQEQRIGAASLTRPRQRLVKNARAIGGMKQPLKANQKLGAGRRVIGAQMLAVLFAYDRGGCKVKVHTFAQHWHCRS